MEEHIKELEQRLARLEQEVRALKTNLGNGHRKDWRLIAGRHEGSEVFEEIMREVDKNSRAEYAAARGRIRRIPSKKKSVVSKGRR